MPGMGSTGVTKTNEHYGFMENGNIGDNCTKQHNDTCSTMVRNMGYEGGSHLGSHMGYGGDDAEIAALYYQLKHKANGDQYAQDNVNMANVGNAYMRQYDTHAPIKSNQMGNDVGHGQVYVTNTRPSLRSQREHLAAQAKGMPRITGVHFEKKSPAWVANWKENGTKKRIWFRVSEFGMEEAYRRAVEARRSAELHLPRKDRTIRKERRRHYETDLVDQLKTATKYRGVRYDQFEMAWIATCTYQNKEVKKSFGIHPYGFEGARQLAIEYREKLLGDIEQNRMLPDNEASSEFIKCDDENQINKNKALEQSGAVAVYYDTATQSWVTCWASNGLTRIRRFPTSKYGFEDAYRMAVQHKQVPNTFIDTQETQNNQFNQQLDQNVWKNSVKPGSSENIPSNDPIGLPPVNPIDKNVKPYDRDNTIAPLTKEEYKGLIIECILDLRTKVVPKFASSDKHHPPPPPHMLEYHLKSVKAANTEHELRPYITLFNECLVRKQLPSSAGSEAQQSILHTLSLLMTLTQLLAESDGTDKNKNDNQNHENSNQSEFSEDCKQNINDVTDDSKDKPDVA